MGSSESQSGGSNDFAHKLSIMAIEAYWTQKMLVCSQLDPLNTGALVLEKLSKSRIDMFSQFLLIASRLFFPSRIKRAR